MISIIITTRNEERNLPNLLDSLVAQEQPIEIILVDSGSEDRTVEIAQSYAKRYDFIKIFKHGGTRGESRNFGAKMAKGDALAFIDGDCIAHLLWMKEMRKGLEKGDIVAGKTINIGNKAFEDLDRVELFYKGFDLTFPSCNLTYKKEVFDGIEGFDSWFRTAEDIDLNYRAVDRGAKLIYAENAVVYHRTRSNLLGFFKQAFWNGFGRKQLTLKHGRLWKNYRPIQMIKAHITFWYITRIGIAFLGYFTCKFFRRRKYKPKGTAAYVPVDAKKSG
ncbi:MAG: glycosyltransferase [Methanomassiliicoccales archaeon]|nr:MAG: glycosyltransferase [Methanomassiliicoccales archaeon]